MAAVLHLLELDFPLNPEEMDEDRRTTLRTQLEQVGKTTGKRDPRLDGPEIPPAGEHIWAWFWALDSARSSSGFGISPIGYGDIDAWARRTGVDPTPWEVSVLRDMDMAYCREMRKRSTPKVKVK